MIKLVIVGAGGRGYDAYGKLIKGRPIVYGIAVLKNSVHHKEAKLFERFVTGKKGADILKNSYQTPIYPPKLIKADE